MVSQMDMAITLIQQAKSDLQTIHANLDIIISMIEAEDLGESNIKSILFLAKEAKEKAIKLKGK